MELRSCGWYYKCRLGERETTGQGGLLSGVDPTAFTTADPVRLCIIRICMIVLIGRLLSLALGKMRQPKVIAEVLGGILLGPSVMGRIPGFTEHIFPAQSFSYLSLIANIGICLFLFIVGLEVDASIVTRNARSSLFIALSTTVLSFGLGAAISVPLYNNFIGPPVEFVHFMLFTGVSFSITSFPVLCRILTSLKLLDTTVGVVALTASMCNDVFCWSLLALVVALINGTSGLTALWILLAFVAFTAFLMWPVRIALLQFSGFTGSLENGPTIFFMIVILIVLWACAFFTDIVGISAFFGAFLAGVVVPREGALAVSLTRKLEDVVTIVFLPLYFTLSGLNTDLGLLNTGLSCRWRPTLIIHILMLLAGTTWGFIIAIICLDFAGKFSTCTITSRISGMNWRESSTVGSLMCCKGPVELIILNIGLSTGILTRRVFSMFVLEALVLTFITTPLVLVFYRPEHRVRALAGEVPRWSIGDREEDIDDPQSPVTEDQPWRSRFTVVIDKFDHMSGMLAATQLALPSPRGTETCVNALRLIGMPDFNEDMKMSSAVRTLIRADPVMGAFRTFGELNNIRVSRSLCFVPYEDMSKTVFDHATQHGSELILLQWFSPSSIHGEDPCSPRSTKIEPTGTGNPVAMIHSQFVRKILAESNTDVALFIDPGTSLSGTGPGSARHIFFPFFGGPDDRLALEFVMQLCTNPGISATVVRMSKGGAARVAAQWPSIVRPEPEDSDKTRDKGYHGMPIQSTVAMPSISYGQTRFESETADTILWEQYVNSHSSFDIRPSIRAALSCITFSEHSSSIPLHSAIQQASMRKPVLVVVGRSHRFGSDDLTQELDMILKERGSVEQDDDTRSTIGNAATAFVASGCATAVVVLQAANVSTD
ncbi:Sodium/hydrogen exchanger family-domain-containing protein [Suillus discolor]|uniref:Sodium/hydrogen exchanger family-domain-containing protein n=1 Tax=Suillus discolor TaxID=1912936 RepID=A0A9P7JRC1_9AGAM|nr:Sodium/hydrogen exchanger family-domain-containing protein [Suillus discolor]KAG2101589.1 Sodium/hydrogen exchanger family-domain-containing protein [Suillus discolor]